ncbi:hypothetical protein SLE2022_009920 [Rubroshorea leprosula]
MCKSKENSHQIRRNCDSAASKSLQSELYIKTMGSVENCSGSESEVVTIDFHQAKNLIDSGYGYLDVRTVEEYRKGHVSAEKIFNIPYMFNTAAGRVKNPEFLKEVSSLCNEDDLLIVGCQSGVRSLYATADLLTIGFKNVSNMGGGYLAWVGNGFPVKMEEIHVPGKLEEKPKQEMKVIPVPANVEEKPKQENVEIPVPVKVEENPKQENGEIAVPVTVEENPKQEP